VSGWDKGGRKGAGVDGLNIDFLGMVVYLFENRVVCGSVCII
jgi:hypothetical protein